SAVLGGGSSTPVQTGGNVYITSTPTGADIIIDGKTTAYITPYTVPGLSAGTHTITLKLAGYQEASSTFAIGESGGTVTVILPLAPETGPTKELPGFIWGLAVLSLVIAALGTGKKI
ncbi:MAG: PEGA domain-containing protein, partial [Methanogenium sp.]|nr:PEGA domain-containing protein [Methanogenium sp.]